jgi:two-component SAPR family response regulator
MEIHHMRKEKTILKALLVDDEPLAVAHLRYLLERGPEKVEVTGAYSNPYEALEAAAKDQPDVVFLDIEMPGMNGLQLAEKISDAAPEAELVFITGYNQYAVEAFELSALDYVMKPVIQQRLYQTVNRLKKRIMLKSQAQRVSFRHDDQPMICCFKQLRVQFPGEAPQLVKWRTSKSQELFAFLLHRRNEAVGKEIILDALWPGFEQERAVQLLYTTIYQTRKTLSQYRLKGISIRSAGTEGGYVMTLENVKIDTEEWEKALGRMDDSKAQDPESCRSVLDQYKGDYLEDYDYLWAESERERLRRIWLHHMQALAERYLERGDVEEAIQTLRLIQQRFPYEEKYYFQLMKLYDAAGDRIAVERQYHSLAEVCERELACSVSDEIAAWYASWKQAH